jgi:hypothetical protein
LRRRKSSEDECAHHDLADLCRADHEGAHMSRIEWQRGAAVGTGPALSE